MDQPSSTDESGITLRIKFKSESVDHFIARYGTDVSPGGIFIRTRDPLGVGTSLRFEFSLVDATPLLVGQGTVVWVREQDQARAGVVPGMGVRFDKLTAHSQTVLGTILAGKARRDRDGLGGSSGRRMTPTTATQKQPSPGFQAGGTEESTEAGHRTQPGLGDKVAPSGPEPTQPLLAARPARASQSAKVIDPEGPTAARPARPAKAAPSTEPVIPPRPSRPSQRSFVAEPFARGSRPSQPVLPQVTESFMPPVAPKSAPATEPSEPVQSGGAVDPWQADKTEIAVLPPSFIAESRRDDASSTEALSLSGAIEEPLLPTNVPAGSTPPPTPPGAGVPTSPSLGVTAPSAEPPSAADRAWEGDFGGKRRGTANRDAASREPPPAFGADRGPAATRSGRPSTFDDDRDFSGPAPGRPPANDAHMRTTTPGMGVPEGIGAGQPQLTMSAGPAYNSYGAPSRQSGPMFPIGHSPEEAITDPFNRSTGDSYSVTDPVPRAGRGRMFVVIGLAAAAMAAVGFYAVRVPNRNQLASETTAPPPATTAVPAEAPPVPGGGPVPGAPPAAAAAPASGAGAPAAGAPAPASGAPAAAAAKQAPPPGGGVPAPSAVTAERPPASATAPPPAARPTPAPARPAAGGPVASAGSAPAARRAKPVRARRVSGGAAARPSSAAPELVDPIEGAVPVDPGATVAEAGGVPGAANAIEDPFGSAEEIYWLRVRSTPPGADVLIDGQLEGKTPFQRRIFDTNRPYTLTVRKPGYEPHEQTVSASDGWLKKGNVRTLTVAPKLARGRGGAPAAETTPPVEGEVPVPPPAETPPADQAPPPPPPAPAPTTPDPITP